MDRRGFLRLSALGGVSLATLGLGSLFSDKAEARRASSTPVKHLKASSAFVIGEGDFLDDSHSKEVVNADLDTPFYTGSLIKPLAIAATLKKVDEDARAVEAGQLKAEDALCMDSIVRISPYSAKEISSHVSFQEEMTLREALEMAGSFSLNDVMHSVAERVAHGKPITRDLSHKESKALEEQFVAEYMRSLAEEIGMQDTVIHTSTGLATYQNKARTIPTWKNDSSTQRDMMKMVNHVVQEYPQHLYKFGIAEMSVPQRKKPYKNSVPLLESSTRGSGDKVQSIPTEGVIGFKTGLNNLALWQSICLYDLSKSGGEGYMATMSLGNKNDTYATEPQRVFNAAKNVVEQRLAMASTPDDPNVEPA